ncbi:hypothetical protein [Tenacibaculum piscium]|uniref:hypothetical protein n=1 Tax=Tenacibaculum piscium TaxID=1458515 RepID=UPI001F18B08F|nr:hypothetical protein [Tenacibaculum piscium]
MNKIILLLTLISWSVNAQINSNIEGVIINLPCKLEYTENTKGANIYTSTSQYKYNENEFPTCTASVQNSSTSKLSEEELNILGINKATIYSNVYN